MNAKLSNFSELSNILSVKSSLRTNLICKLLTIVPESSTMVLAIMISHGGRICF